MKICLILQEISKSTISNENKKEDSFKRIELKNISFNYEDSKKNIFENLNLVIEKNDCIGIIGENGSGKTTLVDILLGLLEPSGGQIYLNNLKQENNSRSKFMGYLPQDHLVISDKIERNITLEISNEKVNKKKLNEAVAASNLQNVINTLPKGLDSYLGKNGIKLSGGQYKKIALARLFYHNKEVLIMDEATNSLDEESDNIVLEEIEKLKKKRL